MVVDLISGYDVLRFFDYEEAKKSDLAPKYPTP